LKQTIIDNTSGFTGLIGIFIGKCLAATAAEWLVFLSILLILCQLFHWGWRFGRWITKPKKLSVGDID
jgi:O-antigen/teichoic acid export membrane protein